MDNLRVLSQQQMDQFLCAQHQSRFIVVMWWDGRHVLDTQTGQYVARDVSRSRAEHLVRSLDADPLLVRLEEDLI